MKNIIQCDPEICSGNPRIHDSRVTVYNVVTRIYLEDNLDIACEDLRITENDAKEAVFYCSELKCIVDESLSNFCGGCFLGEIVDRKTKNRELELFYKSQTLQELKIIINDVDNDDKYLMRGWELAKITKAKVLGFGHP
ncbi:MAG: DUF433 domain-containing protein [bacterium]|nr:DUF433 domain-containing protein [bacterium]